MKPKLIIVAILCAISLGVNAQINKKDFLVGGSFSFGTTRLKNEEHSINNFNFIPRFAYVPADNFLLGIEFPLTLSKLNGISYTDWNYEYGYYENTTAPRELRFGISPFVRKYFNLKNRLKLFAQANFTFQIVSTALIDDDGYLVRHSGRLKGLGANVNPGIAYFFSKKVSVEFSFPLVNYFHQNYTDENSRYNYPTTNNLDLVLENFTPILGINAHF